MSTTIYIIIGLIIFGIISATVSSAIEWKKNNEKEKKKDELLDYEYEKMKKDKK